MSHPRLALAALALSMILASMAASSATIALPVLVQDLGVSFPDIQWVILAYLLSTTMVVVVAGSVGDRLGRRRLILGGLVLFAAASALCGAASGLPLLLLGRTLQGLGAAAMLSMTTALASTILPKNRTGSALGLLGSMSAIGTALGPSAGGLLIALGGWPLIFLINVPLAGLAAALIGRALPKDVRNAAPLPLDVPGMVLLAVILGFYALALTRAWPLLLLASLVGAGLFLMQQRRSAAPLIRPALIRLPGLRPGLMASTLVGCLIMTTLVVGPFHLSHALGLPPALVGLALALGPAVSALTGWPAGRLVDRFGAATPTALGLGVSATGCGLLAVLPFSWGLPGYLGPLALVTAGYALFQTANNTAMMRGIPADQRGLVSGLVALSRNLGLITGTAAMGAVFAWAAGTPDILRAAADDIAHATRLTFGVAGATAILALITVRLKAPSNRFRGLSRQRDETISPSGD